MNPTTSAPPNLLAPLLPAGIACHDMWQGTTEAPLSDALTSELYSEEAAHLEGAVTSRRRDFAGARLCARAALSCWGIERPVMLPGERGAPTWPPGVVGSMTHCAG